MLNLLQNGGNFEQTLAMLSFYAIAILSALILHEVAHGWVAYWCGDVTAKFAGRLSLNPVRHLDPLGTLCFLLFGFGWAVPVPVNPINFRNRRRGCLLVSLAGIAMNLLLALVASFFFVLLYQKTVWSYLFMYMLLFNIVFATFNLLPFAPLDGFNLLASLFPHSGYVRFMRQNRGVALVLLLVVVYFTNVLTIAQDWLTAQFLKLWGWVA